MFLVSEDLFKYKIGVEKGNGIQNGKIVHNEKNSDSQAFLIKLIAVILQYYLQALTQTYQITNSKYCGIQSVVYPLSKCRTPTTFPWNHNW